MSLDIGDALSDGLDRTFARNGLVLVAVFVVFGLVNAIIQQSYSLVQYREFDLAGYLTEFFADVENFPFDQAEIQDLIDQAVQQATTLAYLDGLSLPVLFALTVVLAFVAEAIRIVAIRVFLSEETESIEGSLLRRNILWATFNGVLGGIVVLILIGIGLVLLILPGIFLAVTFYFVRQEIAVEDKNFVDAMSDSWALTKGSRIEVIAIAVILIVVGFGVSLLSGLFSVFGALISTVVTTALGAVVAAYSVATVSQAYGQLKAEDEEADELDEYMDEDLDPV